MHKETTFERNLVQIEEELDVLSRELGDGYGLASSFLWDAASNVPWSIVAVSVAQIAIEFLCDRDQKFGLALLKKAAARWRAG
jgi:hypothetical protein